MSPPTGDPPGGSTYEADDSRFQQEKRRFVSAPKKRLGEVLIDAGAGEGAFVGRMAASVLNAIHLPELITTTPEAYEQMAIDLATYPEKLTAIKNKLAVNRLTMPLFDTKLFTKHIEAAYTAMYERYQTGLPPDHIVIPN